MPTCGWIYEGDLDRFWGATSHTPDPGPPPDPRFYCPFCHASFATQPDLGEHLGRDHRAHRPYLSIAGREPSQTEVLREELVAGTVALFNATNASLSHDGIAFEPCELDDISSRITARKSGRLWVRMANKFEKSMAPVTTEYSFSFKIYNHEQLSDVDKIFVERLGRPDPTILAVDEFMNESAPSEAAEYSSALADYVLGVLIKDGDSRTGVRKGLRDHRSKLNGSLRVLRNFDRPLPNLVSALIRFSSNDFSQIYWTGLATLDLANELLVPLTRSDGSIEKTTIMNLGFQGEKRNICPIDNGGDCVMRWAARLSLLSRWSHDLEDSLRAEVDGPNCDPLDRAKISALWAATATRLEKNDAAKYPLRILVGNDCFGDWAERLLEEIEE